MGKHRKPITIALQDWFYKAYPTNKCDIEEVETVFEYIADLREMLDKLEDAYKERQVFLTSLSPDNLPTRNGEDY